ncbi:zinc knuckle protein [Trichinella spiralis]|nr:zinc knuckle protein [Trichinella spiralis]
MARTKEVCFRCLETGHMAKGCRGSRPCGVDGCRQAHHRLLHPPSTRESTGSSESDRTHQGLLVVRSTSGKGLQTARACAYGPNGNHVVVNCLLDTGAAISFIRKDVAKALGLTGPHERCRLTTLGGRVGPERRWRRVEFRLGAVGSSGRPDASTMVKALAIPRVYGKSGPAESPNGTPARTVPEGGQRQGTPLMVDVLVGIDYYYELVTGRIRRATGGSVAVETRLGWITCGRAARRRSIEAKVLPKGEDSDDSPLRKFGEVGSSRIAPAGDPAADGAVASKRLELDGSYGNLRVGKVGGCVDRERGLWKVDVRSGAVGSLGQPVASRRMGAFAIQRIREKVRQGEMDISDKSQEAAVTKMKRRQWPPIGVDVRIEVDYYFGFVTGRMRSRATGGPVALEALFGWVVRGRASPRWTAEVETFLTNSGKSADVALRKTGEIEAVEIIPEEDVPEGNKEAMEKREEILDV